MHLDEMNLPQRSGDGALEGRVSRGLVLMGGGARTAYQAGALQALAGLLAQGPAKTDQKFPFEVLIGTSAGALNATYLASRAADGLAAMQGLGQFWQQLRSKSVFHLPNTPMAPFSRWATALGLTLSVRRQGAALDSMPLVDTLHRSIALNGIESALRSGALQTAQEDGTQHWSRPGRRAESQSITIEHLMASSAIPFLFPATPLWVDGGLEYFGDGSMRQSSPLSPAVHLGANRILAIGVGQPQRDSLSQDSSRQKPSLGNIAGHAMASVFHDTLLADVEQIQRVNHSMRQLSPALQQALPFQQVQVLTLQPSESLDALAQAFAHELPKPVLRVLEGLGALRGAGAALSSYLLFEPGFVQALMEMGVRDVVQRKEEFLNFFAD
jgi:NTE family protein